MSLLKAYINKIVQGDCREVMRNFPPESIDMIMFSPPYWGLRNYGEETETVWGVDPNCEHEWNEAIRDSHKGNPKGPSAQVGNVLKEIQVFRIKEAFCVKCGAWKGQLGLEPDWRMYVEHIVEICREIKRVLKKTGSMYIVIGDTYACKPAGNEVVYRWQHGNKPEKDLDKARVRYDKTLQGYQPKCLMGIPWRVAFALIDDGWILRNDIIWHKPNAMPSSVKDRLTQTYEHIFHFVKRRKYYYDLDAIREPHKWVDKEGRRIGSNQFGKGPFKHKSNPLFRKGKNPGDVISLTKHDVAVRRFPTVNRQGGLGYTDPLHVKPYHPKGKNPGDVVKSRKEDVFDGEDKNPQPFGRSHFGIGSVISDRYKNCEVRGNPKGKNPGDFWSITTKPFKGAHFAVYPETICVRPILSSCPENGIVLDPMCGSGTTCLAAKKLGRRFIGIDINREYVKLAKSRLKTENFKLTHRNSRREVKRCFPKKRKRKTSNPKRKKSGKKKRKNRT
jgi:site-specific DNA-methyltransferase (cytosine-N4-specific)